MALTPSSITCTAKAISAQPMNESKSMNRLNFLSAMASLLFSMACAAVSSGFSARKYGASA